MCTMCGSMTHGEGQHRVSIEAAYDPDQHLTIQYKFDQCFALGLGLAIQHCCTRTDILAERPYILCIVVTKNNIIQP